ncbi:MAG: glycosyltransferase family 2 protein [Actinomycetota bacterium]|nr:glycosyltransferase family 2 protein [Actinomycetota bacterium]
MVVYGNHAVAQQAVRSVAETSDHPFELIVVDNASPDGAGVRLREEMTGVHFLMSDHNLGYGVAANLGVLHGRGRYVGILNSDIQPEPGWLSPLISVLDHDDRAAAAVPMYLEAGGRVQEAGVLVGADAQGYAYGDRLQPDDPEVGFRRSVDYGSAAAMVIRRSQFLAVGGFDPLYGLGYYEDADLSFGLRQRGLRTLYEPRSRVKHLGHSAFGREQRLGLATTNRPIFANRFAPQLLGRPILRRPPWDPHRELIVRDWWADDRILLLDHSGHLGALADAVQTARPAARVTLVSLDRTVRPTAHPGVEHLHPTAFTTTLNRWLERRRHHYGAVITDRQPSEALGARVAWTQPAAMRAMLGESRPSTHLGAWATLDQRMDAETVLSRLGMGIGPCRR